MQNKDDFKIVTTKVRNGKQKAYYINHEGECFASSCSSCGIVRSADEFYKNKKKPYGLDSRCKRCEKKRTSAEERNIYPAVYLEDLVSEYVLKNKIKNYMVTKGTQKNGYIRYAIRNLYGEIIALSCCGCRRILDVSHFPNYYSSDGTGYSGECSECKSKRNYKKQI